MNLGRLGIALSTAVALATACTADGDPQKDPVLDLGVTSGAVCIARGGDGPKTTSVMATNRSDQTITLHSLALGGAQGLKLVGETLLRAKRGGRVPQMGAAHGWPPRPSWLPKNWSRREPVDGAVLKPGEAAAVWVGVEAPSGNGRAQRIEIRYTTPSMREPATAESRIVIYVSAAPRMRPSQERMDRRYGTPPP